MSATSLAIILYVCSREQLAIQLVPAKAFIAGAKGLNFLNFLKLTSYCYYALVTRNALYPVEDPVGHLL
jgi:hypothetical protein